MKQLVLLAILASSLFAMSFSLYYMVKIYHSDQGISQAAEPVPNEHSERIVLISQEQGSFMMNEIQKGAREAASAHKLRIDFWGVYRANLEELLKQIDIAIASKVSGIIIEGVEDPGFVHMVEKATSRGIPVITINSDVPSSLRKTYAGSDHYQEGVLMGEHIAAELKGQGMIGVIDNQEASDTEDMRMKGLQEILGRYRIKLVYASEDNRRSQPQTQAYDILNREPNVSAFIGLPTASGEDIVQAVNTRSRLKEYQIYLFDDSPQTMRLLNQGSIQAGLSQYYEEMGRTSVDLMKRWLDNDRLPLDKRYFTPIRVVTSTNGKESGE